MALSNEDKKDVKTHMGKALANKVSKVTRDKPFRHSSARMADEHGAYMKKSGAKEYNFGAVQGGNFIGSKTSKGWLDTSYDKKTKSYKHTYQTK